MRTICLAAWGLSLIVWAATYQAACGQAGAFSGSGRPAGEKNGADSRRAKLDQKTFVVPRARRPQFTPRDWDGVYFEDIFRDGLVGNRPGDLGQPEKSGPVAANPVASSSSAPSPSGGWSELIAGSVLEDEIKSLQGQLEQTLTTPSKFKSENAKVRGLLTQLSTCFAMIAEYDRDVRWKESSPAARAAFARAAAAARTTTDQAFQAARGQKDQLAELIRGGKLEGTPDEEGANWGTWANRSEIMDRLEQAYTERLKPWTSSESEFQANQEQVVHEVSLIAALSRILTEAGMDDATDTAYAEHARQMQAAASALRQAALTPTYVGIAEAANRIEQACSNCHEAYR